MSNTPRFFIKPKTESPCKDCVDRFVGCHSTCEMYIQFKKDGLAEFIERKNAYKGERNLEEYTIQSIQRVTKYKRR